MTIISNMTACISSTSIYVGIYLPLAPAHSNYRLETKNHNLKSFCNE